MLSRLVQLPTFASLGYRDFRALWWATIWSGGARWALLVVLGWQVYTLEDSSTWVGIVIFSNMVPIVIFAPLGGFLADRLDRRRLVVTSMVANAGITLVLLGLTVLGVIQAWYVAVLAFGIGVSQSIMMPTVQSLVPNLVPRNMLLNAVVLRAASMRGTRIVGPGLSAPLLGTLGPEGGLGLAAVLFGVAAYQVLRIQSPGGATGERSKRGTSPADFFLGFTYVYTHQSVAAVIILSALHCGLTMAFDSMLPVFSKVSLGSDSTVFSYLVLSLGAGAMLGILAIAGVSDEGRKGQLLLLTGLFSGLTPVGLALSPNVPLALLFIAAMGASQGAFMALGHAFVQGIIPDEVRGRISSVYAMHTAGVMSFLNLGYGYFADFWGAPRIFLVSGLAFVATMAVMAAVWPIIRQVYRVGAEVAVE